MTSQPAHSFSHHRVQPIQVSDQGLSPIQEETQGPTPIQSLEPLLGPLNCGMEPFPPTVVFVFSLQVIRKGTGGPT